MRIERCSQYCAPMLPTDLDQLCWVSDIALSPDGTTLAYVVTKVDAANNAYASSISTCGADGTEHREISPRSQNASAPAWDSSGTRIAYCLKASTADAETAPTFSIEVVAARDDAPIGPIASGLHPNSEPAKLLSFSPDGSEISYLRRSRDAHYDADKVKDRPPRRITRMYARLDGEGFVEDRPQHVWATPIDASSPTLDLTPGLDEATSFSWFPNGDAVAVALDDHGPVALSGDVFRVDRSGVRTRLTNGDGSYGEPSVCPNGKRVAIVGYTDASCFPQNAIVGLVAGDGSDNDAEPRWLTTSIDRNWQPMGADARPIWTDDASLVASYENRGSTVIAGITTAGDVTSLVAEQHMVTKRLVAGDTISYIASSTTRPGEAFVSIGGNSIQVTEASLAFTAQASPVDADRYTAGPAEVDCWYFEPATVAPSGGYPLLLNIHGGPFAQFGNFFFDEAQMQVAAGFAVLYCNPRGSSGRDAGFGRAISGMLHPQPGSGWGSVDYDDIMAALDTTLERHGAQIDPDRLGVLGGSYGGYMTSWIVTHTNRFRAACSERACNNLVSLELGSDIGGAFQSWFGGNVLDNSAEWMAMSPISYAADIETPLLILHSDDDLRCPAEQADQLFNRCVQLGKEVEYYRFPGEGHELSRSGAPTHRKQRADIILEFFGRRLSTT